jgi:regulator of protease activity HflC (stomatin/prohibitin superfamily)
MSATITSAPPTRSAFANRELHVGNGYVMLTIGLALIAVACWFAYIGLSSRVFVQGLIAPLAIILAIAVLKGLVVLQPNESLVCLLFGSYVGTKHRAGFWWINPFNSK